VKIGYGRMLQTLGGVRGVVGLGLVLSGSVGVGWLERGGVSDSESTVAEVIGSRGVVAVGV
jgi:hypothetical protein